MVEVTPHLYDTGVFSLDLSVILLIVIPLVLLQIGLLVAALVNLMKKNNNSNDKLIWILIIIFVNIIGPIIYFAIGSNMLDEKAAKDNPDERWKQ